MKKSNSLLTVILLIFTVFLGIETVHAESPPIIPSSFYGEVQFALGDFIPEPGTTQIDAYTDGGVIPAASATITQSSTSTILIYAINVPGNSSDVQPTEVIFKITDRIVAIAPWVSGTNTNLNIHPPYPDAGGPYVGVAGDAIHLSGSAVDSGGDITLFTWNLDNGGNFDDATGQNPTASFTAGVHTIYMKTTDAQGGEGFAETSVISITIGGLSGQIYDSTPKSVTINNVDPYTTHVTYAGLQTLPTNAGTYGVDVTVKDGDIVIGMITGYNLVIAPRPITISATSDSKIYDGHVESSVSPNVTAGNIVSGDMANFNQNFNDRHAGANKTITPSGSVDDGNGGANYAITFVPVTTGTIQPRQLNVTAVTDTKEYDGTIDSDQLPNLSEPLVDGDSGLWTQSFENASAGTGKILTPSGTIIDGNNGNNYTVTYIDDTTGVISPRSIIVTADAKSKVFGSIEPLLTYSYTGELVDGDVFGGDLIRESGEDIGDYEILQGSLSLSPNYTIYYIPANFTIIAVEQMINLEVGWNLVSFNLQPVSSTIEDVLSSITGNYNLVYAWDASGIHSASGNWMKFDPSTSIGNTLDTLDPTMGFWINMTVADKLIVTGSFQTNTTINLLDNVGGWNLVGFPSASSVGMPQALEENGVPRSAYSLVYAYYAADIGDKWKMFDTDSPDFANDLENMDPGLGYWIYVIGDPVWNLDYHMN